MVEVRPLFPADSNSLVIVSNRGPLTLYESEAGVKTSRSVGGLVSAVEPIIRETGGVWVAWGGRTETENRQEKEINPLLPIPSEHPQYYFSEIRLKAKEVKDYYEGFSNACLWPLCHSFIDKTVFDELQWKTYLEVNEKFTDAAVKVMSNRKMVWVHDYHLALVPQMLKKRRPMTRISLFWHIPFPPADIFQALPWAKSILRGMLGSDLVAFHTRNYVNNFLYSVKRILGAGVNYEKGLVNWGNREIRVKAAPIGIDWREFEDLASQEKVRRRAEEIRRCAGGDWLLLGVDRLDYTKGILERLQALEVLWERFPAWRRGITFIQLAVPSRTEIRGYQELKREVEEAVGRINGKYTEDYHVPVKYVFRSVPRDELVAHYLAADMALVTPLRDGLNLVAKEYAVSQADTEGVLLISPLAGASDQLKEALVANPYNPAEMAEKIIQGLTMPREEKRRRLSVLQKGIREQDIFWWWQQITAAWLGGPARKHVLTLPDNSVNQVHLDTRQIN